ncbi:MAG: class I SAM-dependent methyltransferase [Phycisphaerales bacterium]|jgi:SAM-dependent methyltransferase
MSATRRGLLRRLLGDPEARDLDVGGSDATRAHRRMLLRKGLLRRIHQEWGRWIARSLPAGDGDVLEIGSGGGILDRSIEGLVTSDVQELPWVDRVVDALDLPFDDGSLRAVVCINAFHHLPEPLDFLGEAARAVRPGGRLLMVEPWPTAWSSWVYRRLHHEPFDKAAPPRFEPGHPMVAANGALPWIVLRRDAEGREGPTPTWRTVSIEPTMPLSYLLSGGLSTRPCLPGAAAPLVRALECATGLERQGLFARIVLERRDPTEGGRR